MDACDPYRYIAEPCASKTGSDAAEAAEAVDSCCCSCPTGVGDAGGSKAGCGEKASVRSSWMGGNAAVKVDAAAVLLLVLFEGGGADAGAAALTTVGVTRAWAAGAGRGGWDAGSFVVDAEGLKGRRFRSMRTEMRRICMCVKEGMSGIMRAVREEELIIYTHIPRTYTHPTPAHTYTPS